VDAALSKGFDALRDTHLDDYHALYRANRIELGAGISEPTVSTDRLLEALRDGNPSDNDKRYLETLYYQYGRYLLIASSRPGSLPANLQGVWCNKTAGAWNSDYHTNINVQMNYWPAEQTNLSECHIPMIDFVRQVAPHGVATARHYHTKPDGGDVRGWTTYHEVNAWGNTAPAANGTHSYFPEGGLWICQDIWEHYLFTQDKEFLRSNYRTLLDACLFWVDNLWEDERDGTLVANPSLSPEHGDFSLGCTATQGIIYEMFTAAVDGAAVLGMSDDKEVEEIASARRRLSMPKIGLGGQFMEWKDEVRRDLTGDGSWDRGLQRYVNTHRHTNHLFWLHPGSQVVPGRSDEETAYADAMKITLDTRGDEGTGWSRAWKLNFWARLRDGNRAYS
ncbi:MAG: glycoside hydrolase family 95 protein, partial [Muribaculum intestinale]|nr:glycoside hydrolase family 95 protein [Muribaculum intestinale]